jgi:hypothetical protein
MDGHVACRGERCIQDYLQETKRRLVDDIKIYHKIGGPVLHVYGWVQGQMEGACEHTHTRGNEVLGSTEYGEFHGKLKIHLLFKNISALWSLFVHNYER